MKIRYSPRGISDLVGIAHYLSERSPAGAVSVEQKFRKTIDLITLFPHAGRALEQRPAIRVMPIARYPYLVFYTIRDDEIIVLHVRHAARKPVDPTEL